MSRADGLIALVKTYGFGPLVPNTVLLGKAKTPDDPIRHAELLWTVQHRRRNLVIVHEGEELSDLESARRLDIWWGGERRNIGLMLALAFLLRKDEVWRDAEIVIWRIVEEEDEVVAANAQLDELLAGTRFPAQVRTLPHTGEPFERSRGNQPTRT
jgi:solute carrier family 12 (sodium/potassium/chloride transporter), member 2